MSTPPPYANISGIFTVNDKHIDSSKADFDGQARPGQLIIDTSDYSVWVGDADGALNAVGSGGGGTTLPAGNTTEIQFNDAGDFGADANLTYDNSSQTLSVIGSIQTTSLSATEYVQSNISVSQCYVEVASMIPSGTIDATQGNFFGVEITGPTTLSVTNAPIGPGPIVMSFILEIKNGGTNVTWWPDITWAGGTPPTLTTAGTDVLAFYRVATDDWRGFVLALDMK